MRADPTAAELQRNAPSAPGCTGDAGFTLLELLVVLGILTLIVAIAGPRVLGYMGQSRIQAAQVQIRSISAALDIFYLHNGGYPSEQAGLGALMSQPSGLSTWRGPYLTRADGLIDPWGRPYLYRVPGRKGEFDVYTLGRDSKEGGTGEDADVGNW